MWLVGPVDDQIKLVAPHLTKQTVFTMWPKSQDKNLNILRKKSAFKMN